jgi:alkanesulfonate monooxygenase SsuD/methylene tetrahydromethanopterin reductase-like flavin-dependent oxidoreductase (luciferase family)
MRRSIVFAAAEFLPLVPVARRAETAGFHRIWTTENPGRDALVRALTYALHTERIGVATGIAYAFTRAPLALAAAASDIDAAAGGRFALGIGAGTQGMRSRWYGTDDFDHAASRIEEYADLLRTAWRAERDFRFDGRFYRGSYSEMDGARRAVPVWGSGINRTMLRIAARSCDGVAVHPLGAGLPYLDAVVLPAVAEGAAQGGRSPELALWRMTSIDDDGDAARRRARRGLAFYFSTPSYAAPAEESGWGEVAGKVRDLFRERSGDWDAIAGLVPDEMVDHFCLAGTPDEVRRTWAALEPQYEARGVTEAVFQTVGGGPGETTVKNLESIAEVLAPGAGLPT